MKHFLPRIIGVAVVAAALLAPATSFAQTVTSFSPTYGRIGSSVVIKGTGFFSAGVSSVRSVLINGADMQITATDAINGTITVKVPPTASTGVMRITTTTGTVATGGFRVTRLSTSLTFNPGANPTTPGSAGDFSTPCLADLDDDGLLDLIIGFGVYNGTAGSGTLQRYEQASATDANFSSSTTLTPRTLTTGSAPTVTNNNPAITVSNFAKPFVTDLDGDGLLDLLVGENNGTVLHYEQNSAAFPNNFSPVVTLFANPNTATPANRYYARPTVVDLDRDGLLDILVGASDGFIYRYEQASANANTTAGFTALGYIQDVTSGTGVNLDGGDVSKAQVLDIEGDGLLDLLVGNTQGTLQHYVQSAVGAATFTRVGSSTSSFNGISLGNGQYSAPVMADIDGDGLLDLLLGNYNLSANVLRYTQTNNSAPTPLPVTLTAFTGQVAASGAQLRWTTAQEVNSASFVVERSVDGRTFSAVAEQAAAGTSATVHNYQYLDASAEALSSGTRYYRLRQVDQDGTAAYSSVVTLTRSAATAGALTVAYPNPFENELLVALPGGTEPQAATVTLTSLTGQQVYKGAFTLSATPQALTALPALSSGVYVLRLTTAAGTTTQRVSRQ